MVETLKALAPHCFEGGTVTTWSCVRGMEPSEKDADTRDPLAALQRIIASPKPGFYVMKDMTDFMNDPKVVRSLREAYFNLLRAYNAAVVLVSPLPPPSEALQKEMRLVEMGSPSDEEIDVKLREIESQFEGVSLSPELRPKVVLALRGVNLIDVDHIMNRVFNSGKQGDDILAEIFADKGAIAKQLGFLDYVPLQNDTSVVGGLESVKIWAEKRRPLFNQAAVSSGMSIPKGVLIMGVSGCGKSLLAKSIAGLWSVPLFRLNMTMVFSGAYGSPESAFHRALTTVEAIAPAVLWIDEMESSFSAPKEGGTRQSMIYSEFLTWMQEKPPLVFVAATANRIEMLPAEMIRKGRFDEVFFCDLPDPEERYQIFSIHLKRNGVPPELIDINRLLSDTHGFSGAEIEQAIVAATVEAYEKQRPISVEDIQAQISSMVPLSTTMAEQVRTIRDWARSRAASASKKLG